MKGDVRGVIVPIVSTFDVNGDLNIAAFEREVGVMHDAGIQQIIVGGSTGEGAVLEPEELGRLISVAAGSGQVRVIGGVLPTGTRDAVRRACLARDSGAQALLVAPPIYIVPHVDALVRFLEDVGTASDLPIIFYNHFDADAGTLRRIAGLDSVIAIKDASVIKITELLQSSSADAAMAVAIDPAPLAGFAIGATASITGINAVLPTQCGDIYRAFCQGDLTKAREVEERLAPLARLLIEPLNFPAPVKYAINLLGRDVGVPRAPYRTLGASQETALHAALEYAGVL